MKKCIYKLAESICLSKSMTLVGCVVCLKTAISLKFPSQAIDNPFELLSIS